MQALLSLRSFAAAPVAEACCSTARRLVVGAFASPSLAHQQQPLQQAAAAAGSAGLHTSAAVGKQLQSLVSVTVKNNNTDQALRQLTNRLRTEGLQREWRARQAYVKPSEQRVLNKKETEKRQRKREFKQQLRWVMARKNRCGGGVAAHQRV